MVTNLNYYFTYSENFRTEFRVMMESRFEHNLCDKSSSNQREFDDDVDTLRQRIKWWLLVVDRGGPIPNDVYDFTFEDFFMLHRKAIDPEKRHLVKALKERQVIPQNQVEALSVKK